MPPIKLEAVQHYRADNTLSMKSIITLFIAVLLVGCGKDEVNPRQEILGKWEPFYLGNGEYQPPNEKPGGYWHFLPDSVLIEYEYATQRAMKKKYWIDTLLNIAATYDDGYQLRFYYTPQFYADTMELRIENSSAIFYISKWRRLR
jgi:hypothetical protein